jgi:hypothetical protein
MLLAAATWLLSGSSEPAPYRSTGGEELNTAERYQYQPDPGCAPQELWQLPTALDRENKRRECANQAIDYRREIDDLTQQTRAAEAVEKANWFALANFNLAKFQLALSMFAALALAVSLYLTWEAIAVSREIGKKEVRAYMALESSCRWRKKPAEKSFTRLEISIHASNKGQTPAFIQEISVRSAAIYKAGVTEKRGPAPTSRLIRPGNYACGPGNDIFIPASHIDDPDLSQRLESYVLLRTFARVTYRDVFGDRHWVETTFNHRNLSVPPVGDREKIEAAIETTIEQNTSDSP